MNKEKHVYCSDCKHFDVQNFLKREVVVPLICSEKCNPCNPEDSSSYRERPMYEPSINPYGEIVGKLIPFMTEEEIETLKQFTDSVSSRLIFHEKDIITHVTSAEKQYKEEILEVKVIKSALICTKSLIYPDKTSHLKHTESLQEDGWKQCFCLDEREGVFAHYQKTLSEELNA